MYAINPVMSAPLVSVLIPAFNSAGTIQETLESVLRQTYPNIEIIIVDDGSTDKTAQIVLAFNEHIKYIYQPNNGLASARNCGLALAQGEFLALLDADDICDSNRIAIQVAYLLANPDIVLCCTDFSAFRDHHYLSDSYINTYYGVICSVFGGLEKIYEQHQVINTRLISWCNVVDNQQIRTLCGHVSNKIIHGNFIHPPTVMVRRSVAKQVGSFDQQLRWVCDYDWFIRISLLGKIGYIDKPLLKYRLSQSQMSSDRNTLLHKLETIKIIDKIRNFNDALYQSNIKILKKRLSYIYLGIANILVEHDRLRAFSYFFLSLRFPTSIRYITFKVLVKLITPKFLIQLRRHQKKLILMCRVPDD